MKQLNLIFLNFLTVLGLAAQNGNTAKLIIPAGHTAGITSVDFSPNGRYILTGSLDQTVKIWDEAGREIWTLAGHKKNVRAVAFSPVTKEDPDGGKYILTGSSDYNVMLWDIFGNLLAKFQDPSPKGEITSLAFSPDGKTFLVGSKSGIVWLLDDSCKVTQQFSHKNEVNAVTFSPDGAYILAACSDQTAVLWSRSTSNKPIRTFSGHTAEVLCAAFSASGDTMLTGSADGTAILWKLTGEKIRNFQHAEKVSSVALSTTGGAMKIITGSSDGTLKVWNLTDKTAEPFRIFDRGLKSLKCAPNGQSILCGSETKPLAKRVDLNGLVQKKFKGHTSAITCMALSPDGVSLLVGHADSTAKLWDLSSQSVRSIPYPNKLESVAFFPKNETDSSAANFILTGCGDKVCRLQDLSGKVINPFSPATKAVFSADGKMVLTGNADGAIQLWDLNTKASQPLAHSERRITALAYSQVKGSKAFAIGSYDGKVMYWDSVSSNPVTLLLANAPTVNALAFSPDGKSILIGAEGGLTEIRDLKGKQTQVYPNRKQGIQNVRSVAFSPKFGKSANGEKLVLRSTGNNAELWDIVSDRVTVLSGHTSELSTVAFTPDGASIFTASKDGSIKYWSVASGKEIATLVSIDSTDWAVTTPNGLNDASEGAMKLMHFVSGTEVISLNQLKETYWEPGLLAKIMGFSSDSIRNVSRIDTLSLFPEVKMNIFGNKLEVSLKERNGGMGKLSLFINKKRMVEDLNPPGPDGKRLKILPPIDLDKYKNWFRSDIPNTISLVSYNRENVLRSQPYERVYSFIGSRGEGENGPDRNNCKIADPNIFILVVGTSKYDTLSLAFPDQDAAAMAEALSGVGKAMRGENHVFLKQLSTNPGNGVLLATKKNIKAAFDEYAEKAGPCDILVVYFSGHGKNWGPEGKKPNFYYLTSGITAGKIRLENLRNAHAISDAELEEWLNRIPAEKQVLILDACYSGTAVNNIKLKGVGQKSTVTNQKIALTLLNNRTGTWILSGSTADMQSYEASTFGQGLLTYSLLDAMSGAALFDGKFVDVGILFNHASNLVPTLAATIGEKQTPVPLGAGSTFPIGIQDGSVKIKLPQEKPVFTPSKFSQPPPKIKDELNLGLAMNDYFYKERLAGKDARFVYYETSNVLEQGFSVEGSYEDVAGTITVTCNLYQGGNRQIGEPFKVMGAKDAMDVLVKKIWKEIDARLPKK